MLLGKCDRLLVIELASQLMPKQAYLVFFLSWPRGAACGILVPRLGIARPAVEVRSLNHWTSSEVPE